MTLSAGSILNDENGSSHRLSREIARGAEGAVWAIDGSGDRLVKVYLRGMNDHHVAKVSAMCRMRTDALSSVSAWPISLLSPPRSKNPVGLLMRKIPDAELIHQLYGLKSRQRTFPEAQLPFLVHVAANVARAFATVHSAGQVVGDVNHSNLMVARNGTVAMIDCDSFQITDGGRVFRCEVGVPEFTPPELQGSNFRDVNRTPQHDSFGLSILIFYLLFLGRHPFMGMYDRKSDEILSLEDAIGQYKFPYALTVQSPEVKLPAFVPRLNDFPNELNQLFTRSFTKEGLTRNRPSAEEWVESLGRLSGSLKRCTTNPSHHYFSGLSACPWCRVEGVLAFPIFGIKLIVAGPHGFNLTAIWAEIELIKPIPEPLQKPDLESLKTKYSVDPTIPAIASKRRSFRVGSILIVVAFSVAGVAALPPPAAITLIVVSLIIAGNLWAKSKREAEPIITRFASAKSAYQSAEQEFDRVSALADTFIKTRNQLDQYKKNYQGLGTEKAKRLAQLNAAREAKQREHFLETFRIDDATIPLVGPKNKVILRTWGIEDASDVDARKIEAIKGFGPAKVKSLVEWRMSKERLFRFDPKKPIDPRDLQSLEQEFAQKALTLEKAIRQGPQSLRQVLGVWHAQRRQQLARLFSLAEELAHAEVNRTALG
jgi:DNA-binding helix-hairpin-helix protein with protein kinase domain